AAIVVSLLAPGEPAAKIARVAEGFGRTAGTIGIVIALAAIAGQAMLGSGAADRIVRAFIALLGEQRSATALCATGYVLSIPVFFDTVFYLLVPLARSGYTRTNRYYLKYLLAIAAGAGATHTLVPPTPGPLAVASCALHGNRREPQSGDARSRLRSHVGVCAATRSEPGRSRGNGGHIFDGRRVHHPDHCSERGIRGRAAGRTDRARDRAGLRREGGRHGLRPDLSLRRVRRREPDQDRPGLEHRRDDHDRRDAGGHAARERSRSSLSHRICRDRDRQRVARRDVDERQRVLAVLEDGRSDGARDLQVLDSRARSGRHHQHGDDGGARAAGAASVARIDTLRDDMVLLG